MAICGRPRVLFLDEPTVGLDIQAREALWANVRMLLAEGCSIVLTTHYLEEAEALATRVAVLAKGRVIASGSVDEMRALVARRQISCEIRAQPSRSCSNWPGVIEARRERGRLSIFAADAEAVVRRLLAEDPDAAPARSTRGRTLRSIHRTHQGGCMNALALNSIDTDSGLLPPGRALGAYLTEIRFEFMRMLRNPALALPVVLVPLALYLLFAVVIFGDAHRQGSGTRRLLFRGILGDGRHHAGAVRHQRLAGDGARDGPDAAEARSARPAGELAGRQDHLRRALLPAVVRCRCWRPAIAAGTLPLDAGQIVAMSVALIAGSIPVLRARPHDRRAGERTRPRPDTPISSIYPGCYLSGMFFPLPESMHWQAPFWPQVPHQPAGDARQPAPPSSTLIPLQLTIGALIGFTVLFSAVAIWRLARKG